jgi:DNA mismatch repair protein MutL
MIESIQKSPENSPITNQFVSSIACHSAIKSGDKIHTTQITKLINDLSECKNFHTCPHGRPTIFQLTTDQLEKEFARRK